MLADQGLIVRTHGGVKANGSLSEMPVALRDTRFQDAKQRIARAAATRIPRERHAALPSGGTTRLRASRANRRTTPTCRSSRSYLSIA